MIITPKIQGTGVLFSLGRRSAPWIVALAAGSIFLACSGTIDTPTDEYPNRGSNAAANDDDDDTAAANDDDDDDAPAPPRPQPPAANDDDDDDAPAQPAAEDDEEPPVDEEPPGDEPPPAEEPAPSGGVTFEADVFPILSTACAPCHAGSTFGGNDVGGPDLETAFEEASRVADRVVDRISTGGMPPACAGGDPGDSGCVSEDDLATIEAWVEAGLPE